MNGCKSKLQETSNMKAISSMKSLCTLLMTTMLAGVPLAEAAPYLGLVKSGTASQNADSINLGTFSYSLDLRLDTDGHAVSGLQYYFLTSPADALTFGPTPLTALNNPFTSSDVFLSPATGDTVNQAEGTTVWFKSGAGDYGAFGEQAIARYELDTALLGLGSYVFTPVGEELSNGSETVTDFGLPGTFTLVVVPEPGTFGLVGLGGLALLAGRWRSRRRG
jgi:hypothetical protein